MNIDLTAIKRHRKIQTENIGARIDSDTKRRLDEICVKADVTVSRLVYELIQNFIKERENV